MSTTRQHIKDCITEAIAKVLYAMRIKPTWSSGVHGGTTCGYGKWSDNGYPQFPLYKQAREFDEEMEREGKSNHAL